MDTAKVLSDDSAKPAADLATARTADAETTTTLLVEPTAAKSASKALPAKSKTATKSKSKKSKKASRQPVSDSSDSGSDSDSDTDAGSTSGSDSSKSSSSESNAGTSSDSEDEDSDRDADKKRRSKKRRDAKKAKKRKPKRRTKAREPSSSSGPDSDSEADDGSHYDDASDLGDSIEDPIPPRQKSRRKEFQPPPPVTFQQHPAPMYYGAPYGAPYGFPYGGAPFGVPMGNPFMPGLPPTFDSTPQHRLPPPPGRDRRSRRDRSRSRSPSRSPSPPPGRHRKHRKASKHKRTAKSMTFKRVDLVWDNLIHDFKLQDTAERTTDTAYEGYLFHVRRTFDWEGQYKQTFVDIKSKVLREALQEVMGEIKGVSLVEDIPKLDPNLLFVYLEDMRTHLETLKNAKPKGDKKSRKKALKNNKKKRQQLKVLVKYIDKDYEALKNSLKPMLDNGVISFDLLWALWKPNTLAYTTTYGSTDQPRVFKVELADKHQAIMKGQYYYIEGKYFEYDGKRFGFGTVAEEIGEFRGTCKITSLPVYPLKYHKNEALLRQELIERGKKFVALSGVQYKSYEGMAYVKKKKMVVRVNVTGRIMIDFSIHRRINPNYPTSIVHPQDGGGGSSDEFESDSSDADAPGAGVLTAKEAAEPKSADNKDGDGNEGNDGDNKQPPVFSDEEYLMASPVVLGFAFNEKLWLEFTVSNVKEILWNDNAYQSLVLEPKTKDIVKALVESHKYHAAESIDDVIQGKGKGLVAVLHGPPGTGKTLTAEGISELLKCPLYMVSAGELGTDSRFLEMELQKVLDICHAWGAILLLDEADVFLEKRNMHDIQRNALVSIFLRQLEYFQGILFLTTNRVETFDDAFQSRIHIALRYGSLDHRAKKTIFKIFIERVRVLEKIDMMPFTEDDYNALARHDLNGRQIKNTVRTAQALAVNKGEPLSMGHIRQVLDVQMSFDRDLKGGPGFQDAMRSYF